MPPLVVVQFAAHGRQNAGAQVALAHAVFVPGGADEAGPIFAQHLGIHVFGAHFVHGPQPYQLKIQIVVGQNHTLFGDEALNVVDLLHAFIGRAHGAADVFADPAGVDLVAQLILIEFDGIENGRLASHVCIPPSNWIDGVKIKNV